MLLIICFTVGGAVVLTMRFVDITGLPSILVYMGAYVIVSTAYWQLIPATFYDLCEVDEYENHVKRAGTITSILPITQSLAAAVGVQALGIWLQLHGFVSGAKAQSDSALIAILDCFTTIPGIMLLLGAVALIFFPITKQKFAAIKQALSERNKE
jgi:Na+/melibiose symporter-like transporter